MKPNVCEKCIIQSSCTKICVPHVFEAMNLHHQIIRIRDKLYSQKGYRRKRIPQPLRLHYNILVTKHNKNVTQGNLIIKRRIIKRVGVLPSDDNSFGMIYEPLN